MLNYFNEYFPQEFLIGEYSHLFGINKGVCAKHGFCTRRQFHLIIE